MKIKIITTWILSTLIIIGGFLVLKQSYKTTGEHIRYVHIKVLGAVQRNGTFDVPANSTMRDLVKKIGLLENTDRTAIDFNKTFINDQAIIFKSRTKQEKIKITNKLTLSDLAPLGVSLKIKKELYNYFKKAHKWSWADLDSLRGVGMATLKLLKERLDISYGT